jgi:hypothetical protein
MSSNFDGVILRGFPPGAENKAGVNPSQGSSRLDSHAAGCELKWVKLKQSSAATVLAEDSAPRSLSSSFPRQRVSVYGSNIVMS